MRADLLTFLVCQMIRYVEVCWSAHKALSEAERRVEGDRQLKVHKNENFFGFDFEFCTVSLLIMLKYEGFVKQNF
jgi:hypothetical protein